MLAKIVTDNRFRFQTSLPLKRKGKVKLSMTVDNGLVGDIVIAIRDNNNTDILSVGTGGAAGLPLSTGPTGSADWSFDPAALGGPGYVAWNIWVNDTNTNKKQFTVTVNAVQNGVAINPPAIVTAILDDGALVAGVGLDGLLIP